MDFGLGEQAELAPPFSAACGDTSTTTSTTNSINGMLPNAHGNDSKLADDHESTTPTLTQDLNQEPSQDPAQDDLTQLDHQMTHTDAMKMFRQALGDILEDDPLLSDLPADVTPEEVGLQIALEYGQAMTVCVKKATGEVMPVVVLQGASVQDLKHAIQRFVTLKEERKGNTTSISWRYIWRTFSLCFDGEPLDKNKKLKEYGVRNKAVVTFVKRGKQKGERY